MYYKYQYHKQHRLPDHDYTSGTYFVTICTKYRQHYFGYIENEKMVLSKIGMIVEECWKKIPQHFRQITLDEFIVMPNHVHGLLSIQKPPVGTCYSKYPQFNHYAQPITGSLSMIINTFKGAVTRQAHQKNIDFKWQSRFHDIIVNNEKMYWAIKQYIQDNPKHWQEKILSNNHEMVY